MAPTWAPALTDVAARVPHRTVAVDTVSDALLNTFTVATRPTNTQVDLLITEACAWVMVTAGEIVTTGALATVLADLAKATAATYAAAKVELAYPVRDADLNTGDALLVEAKDMLARLDAANRQAGAIDPDNPVLLPLWSFPAAPAWADVNL